MTEQHQTETTPWWRQFFDDDYAAFGLAAIDAERTRRTADFIIEALDLQPGQTVFDQCCGIGRLSMPLAERGIRVIGVDLIESYVAAARHRAQEDNLSCEFHQGDAHEFIAPEPCDAAINWYTSFGYDEDDAVNIRVLRCAFESLKPGGRLALDYYCTPAILAGFRPHVIVRPDAKALDDLIVIHENDLDFERGMIHSLWTAIYADGRRIAKPVQTRLYLPHEIIALLKRCGFVDTALCGDIDGSAFARDSRRCIATARRPS